MGQKAKILKLKAYCGIVHFNTKAGPKFKVLSDRPTYEGQSNSFATDCDRINI